MRHAQALAGELSLVSKEDFAGRRGHAVDRLVDEFARQAPVLASDAIELYDVALRWLVTDLETTARAALSERLANIPNAPPGVVRILAFDDDIAIAGPVLARSPRLESGDLIAIIGQKGQEHILLIARRANLSEPVTDELIAHGSAQVLQTLAGNGDAALSGEGRAILVRRAGADHRLAAALADRFGLPAALRDRLLDDATLILRAHLATTGAPEKAVEQALAAGVAIAAERGPPQWTPADAPDLKPGREGAPQMLSHEARYVELIRQRRISAAADLLAERAGLPAAVVNAALSGGDLDGILTLMRAADMSWAAAEETVVARMSGLDRTALREIARDKYQMTSVRDARARISAVRRTNAAA